MGKGSGETERQALSTEGDVPHEYGLSSRIWLSKPAVENWARVQDSEFVDLISAKAVLLNLIDSDGELNEDGPEWMTSAPETDAWVILPNDCALMLTMDDDSASSKAYIATNCRAPKKKRRGSGDKPKNSTREQTLSLEAIDAELDRATVQISLHAQERLAERIGHEWDEQTWRQTIADATLAQLPSWADSQRSGQPSFVISVEGDEWALPIRWNSRANEWLIPTVFSRAWVLDDIEGLRHDRSSIELPSAIKDTLDNWEHERDTAAIDLRDDEAGVWLFATGGPYWLRPADVSHKARGIKWIAVPVVA